MITDKDGKPILRTKCIRCGKKLKTYKSKLRGYGPECYRREMDEKCKITRRKLL